jgi:hypothetical protein
MTEYENGYRKGYVDAQLEQLGVDALPERVMTEAQLAARDAANGLTDEALSDYWLGYYHGRYHGRTGQRPPGARPQVTQHKCLHCNYKWTPRQPKRPGVCPRCKSYNWDKEPQRRERKERTMTTTITRMNDRWSATRLYDPSMWGEDATEEDAKTLGDAVRDHFAALAPEGVTWHPHTSELLVNEDAAEFDADELLERAYAEVWGHIGEYIADNTAITPGAYHEAWARISDATDGEYLSGTVESIPDDRTFTVRAVPSGRLWECRHLGDGQVVEAEVIG